MTTLNANLTVMLSAAKHPTRSSNSIDWVYYHTRDASAALSMTVK
jgi:hypothetical protein